MSAKRREKRITDKERLDFSTKATNWYRLGEDALALRRTVYDDNKPSHVLALYPRQAIDAAIRATRRPRRAK